jgi:hypothetical protein
VNAQEFEALIRRELTERDKRKRARLGDALAYAEADQRCVNAILEAAGYGAPSDGERLVRRAQRARRANEDEAFGESA